MENRLRELHGRYMAEKKAARHYAAEMGVDQSTLTNKWRKMGLPTRSIGEANIKAIADVGEKRVRSIHALYIEHRWSAERAAKEMGVAKHVLRRMFGELGLPRHTTCRGRSKRLTPQMASGAYEAYKNGERVADVAARLGFCTCTLAKRWKEAGLTYPLRPQDMPHIQALPDLRKYPSVKKRAWVEINLDTVLAAVEAVSRAAVAQRLGIDPFMIERAQASKESVQ